MMVRGRLNLWLVIIAIVPLHGCSKPAASVAPPAYGVQEMDTAVTQIVIDQTTRDELDALIGPYVVSRGLYPVKETGRDRDYFFVMGERQIWIEFSLDADGIERVSGLGELAPKSKYIKRHEGGYLTFDPDEPAW